jgi:serine/threonine protein kinase
VYLGVNKFTNATFAIKFFDKELCCISELDFLYKEIESLKRLRHDSIIKLHNFCTYEEKIVLILEYASGGNLKQYLKERVKLSEEEVSKLFKQILEAVKYCHSKDIIHRDIKLENILFSDDKRDKIKIIDFGVSGLIKNEKTKCGTLRYMPPEVVAGINTNSLPSIDVWGLGCILYELITGEVLFKGVNKSEIKVNNNLTPKDAILKGKFILCDIMSVEASHLLNKMLKADQYERISIEDALKHPWVNGEAIDIDDEVQQIISRTNRSKKERCKTILHSRTESKSTNRLWEKYFCEKEKRPRYSGIIFIFYLI